jgi:hypothetical protein
MSPSPTLPFYMKISRQVNEVLLFFEHLDHTHFLKNFRKFLKTSNFVTQVDKICSRILWTWLIWHTFLGWYRNLQLLQPWFFLRLFTQAPCPFIRTFFVTKNFHQFVLRKNFWTMPHIHLTAIAINYHDGNSGYNSLLSRAFSVGIPSWMGF